MRRVLMPALLLYLTAATWVLTTRFAAWGDDLASTVQQVATGPGFRDALVELDSVDGGITFVECMCATGYSERGVQLSVAALYFGGTPLALATVRLRRRLLEGFDPPPSGLAQMGLMLQAMSLMLTVLVTPLFIIGASLDGVSAAGMLFFLPGVFNVAFGAPALAEWRRLQTAAFGAPRPLLRLARG